MTNIHGRGPVHMCISLGIRAPGYSNDYTSEHSHRRDEWNGNRERRSVQRRNTEAALPVPGQSEHEDKRHSEKHRLLGQDHHRAE